MKSANDLMWIYGRRKLNGGDTPSRVRLPPGYTEVDAISSNKYVDTGFVADPSDEWIVTCRRTGSSANLPVMGGGYSKTDSNMCLWLNAATNLVEFTFGDGGNNSYKVTTTAYNVSEFHTYRMKLSTGEAWIDGNYIGRASQVSFIPHPSKIVLYGCWRGSSNYMQFTGAISEVTIIRSGAEVLHCVPCHDNTIHTMPCFYDIARNLAIRMDNAAVWITYNSSFSVQVKEDDLTYGFRLKNHQYDVSVDWGDGISETFTTHNTTALYSHTYQEPGEYTITIAAPYAGTTLCLSGSSSLEHAAKVVRLVSYSPMGIPQDFCNGASNLRMKSDAIADVTFIGQDAFRSCSSLDIIRFPQKVSYIGQTAFFQCTGLVSPRALPETLISLGHGTFNGCTGLALTSLPSGITSIGNYAFNGCTGLALTSLPSGITSIGDCAFNGCTGLALTSLPSGITSIGNYAFNGCTGLFTISLPYSLDTLDSAFGYCVNLSEVTFRSTPSSIGRSTFHRCQNLTEIRVPWSEGEVADAPWGATEARIIYNYTE